MRLPRPRLRLPAAYAYVMLAVLSLLLSGTALLLSAGHTNATAGRLDAQARGQAATVARLKATIAQLRAQQLASCAFTADLGSIPLADKPKPSKLGVSIVADSRAQWRGDHCPGTLPMPPGLVKWAAVYHLPVN